MSHSRHLLSGRCVRGLMLSVLLLGALSLSGCYGRFGLLNGVLSSAGLHRAPVVPPPGLIYTSYKAPLDYDFTNDGVGTTVSDEVGSEEANTHFIRIPFINLSFAWGDAGIETAQEKLKTSDYADYEFFTVLTIYSNFAVHAYGER
ncbi:hypothetical protein IT570_09645 [Candidatus Sumerlaeota bacterium]|nr:hypothetical protein [Candidatus Sumerlaeota bacterium]